MVAQPRSWTSMQQVHSVVASWIWDLQRTRDYFSKSRSPRRSNRNYLERIQADTTQIRSANDWCSNHKRGEEMTKHIALAGNPNSGKTTLFNLLTGTNQRVGNWPGVTVERKSGTIKSESIY